MAFLVYLLVIISTVAQSASTKKFTRTHGNGLVFNAIKSAVAAVLLLIIALAWGFSFHLPTVLYGAAFGLFLCISMYCGYKALALGPMSLTSMLVSFSVVLPLLYGVFFCNEPLNILKYCAFFLIAVAILSANTDKIRKSDKKTENYALWIFFVAMTFLVNGFSSIVQKRHQIVYPELYSREFTFYAMLVCAIVYLVLALLKTSPSERRLVVGKRFGVLAGATNGLASLFTVVLAGMENASVLFPIVSVGTILGSLLCGRFIFREKLKINHYIAFVAGALAVLFLKL